MQNCSQNTEPGLVTSHACASAPVALAVLGLSAHLAYSAAPLSSAASSLSSSDACPLPRFTCQCVRVSECAGVVNVSARVCARKEQASKATLIADAGTRS